MKRESYLFVIGCLTYPVFCIAVMEHAWKHLNWLSSGRTRDSYCSLCKQHLTDFPLSFKLRVFRKAAKMVGYHPLDYSCHA